MRQPQITPKGKNSKGMIMTNLTNKLNKIGVKIPKGSKKQLIRG